MPKIEVNEKLFFDLLGSRRGREELESMLQSAKAELDEWIQDAPDEPERTLKIELNDTNRPDLWSTSGLARQLRTISGGEPPAYPFFSRSGDVRSAAKRVLVKDSVRPVRPWLAGFAATGIVVTDSLLKAMIQTQEKLAWNFGRKRRTVSIGLYRTSRIDWPIVYRGVDPDVVAFVPLQETRSMTMRQILAEHPKGVEYRFILEHEPVHPILEDAAGNVLSYPPIINSADLGAVRTGDSDLFIEVTGSDMHSVCLACSILACDFADQGFEIEPVKVEYEYDTPFGRDPVFPWYFQKPVAASTETATKLLGKEISVSDMMNALRRMGCTSVATGNVVSVNPPEYRNDFLHPVDVVEDVMIGMELASFEPEPPRDFTIGRLSGIEISSRRVKTLMIGLGYQEMIYNYLGSGKDYIDRMCISPDGMVRISNPMSENFEYVRNSPLPCLLGTEAVSAGSAYPHRTFEIGKVAVRDASENYGVRTCQSLGFMISHQTANYNEAAGHVATLMYYLGFEYSLQASEDPRFIPGRQASIRIGEREIGVFGELHPAVLDAWSVTMPCVGGEVDLDFLARA